MIGIDLVEPRDAAELTAPQMLARIFTPAELAGTRTADLLGAFAAKEALLKALAWGLDRGLARFAEIEVARGEAGVLVLGTRGRIRRELDERGLCPAGLAFEVGGSQGAIVVLAPSAESARSFLPQLRLAVSELGRRAERTSG